jgi:hypothetical protein
LGVSTTGFLDKTPDDEPASRTGEVYIGCHWVFKGKAATRVERVDVAHVSGVPDVDENQDESDANREARKQHVVDRAIELVYEVVAEIERGETGGTTELDEHPASAK